MNEIKKNSLFNRQAIVNFFNLPHIYGTFLPVVYYIAG